MDGAQSARTSLIGLDAAAIARRLTERAQMFRADHERPWNQEKFDLDFPELKSANDADWAELRRDPEMHAAVCRELLKGFRLRK